MVENEYLWLKNFIDCVRLLIRKGTIDFFSYVIEQKLNTVAPRYTGPASNGISPIMEEVFQSHE